MLWHTEVRGTAASFDGSTRSIPCQSSAAASAAHPYHGLKQMFKKLIMVPVHR